jgi:hypothetical protein
MGFPATNAGIQIHEAVRFQWVVLQRRPLAALPKWKQWLAQITYFILDWQTADGEEKQAICDTEAIAKAIVAAGGSNWFYHRLPVNVSLPANTCTLDGVRFPLSDADDAYKRVAKLRQGTVVCPHSQQLCQPHDTVRRTVIDAIQEQATEITQSLSTLKARI